MTHILSSLDAMVRKVSQSIGVNVVQLRNWPTMARYCEVADIFHGDLVIATTAEEEQCFFDECMLLVYCISTITIHFTIHIIIHFTIIIIITTITIIILSPPSPSPPP